MCTAAQRGARGGARTVGSTQLTRPAGWAVIQQNDAQLVVTARGGSSVQLTGSPRYGDESQCAMRCCAGESSPVACARVEAGGGRNRWSITRWDPLWGSGQCTSAARASCFGCAVGAGVLHGSQGGDQMTVDRFPSAVNRLLICACRASIAGSRSLTRNPQTHWLSWTGSDPFAPPAGWYTGRLTTSVRRDRWSERH